MNRPFFFTIIHFTLLLSACSATHTVAPQGNRRDDRLLTEKIQNVIIHCALPGMYYRLPTDNAAVQVQWYTTQHRVHVKSTMDGALQSCVAQAMAAQSYVIHSGLSGSVVIRGS